MHPLPSIDRGLAEKYVVVLHWRRVQLVLAVVLLASGCMLGPDFRRPAAPVARNWAEAADSAVDVKRQEYRNWWTVFNDPVLTRLVELAYRQNLTLRSAGVRVLETRAQLGIAIGELYPQQQTVGASLTYNRLPISLPYNLVSNTYWSDIFLAQAAWEIDVWGKLRRAIESADDAFLASVADYDDVLVSLVGDVASNYVQVRTAEKQIDIARDNVERQRQALKIAEAKFEGGTATKLDVYQAENVLGSTEAVIPQQTITLEQSKNTLSVLLGLPPGQIDQLLTGPAEIPTAPQTVAVGIPADLLRRRPDVRRAELQAAAQCAQIGFAKADLFPVFSLTGDVGTLGSNVTRGLDSVFTSASLFYGVGPSVQWNILNYGQITNNVRVQDAKFQELLIGYQNAVLKAQQEVEDGLAVFLNSRDAVVYLEESVKAAAGAVRIAVIQYREGTRDFTTVLTAEQNLYQAQNNLAVAQGSVPLGLIEAYRALGGGWQLREGQDLVPAATRAEMEERTNWGRLLTPDLLQPKAPDLPSPKDQGPLVRPPEF
ncbi:MAG TPA: efflux transporter outer membrane subunit [Candidatus Binataceae bacterium]|nr:efflux transporter outer membrane subunit [Candidatus Binataceae bacterium]